MAQIRELQTRLISVKKTRQITNAMKTIASVKYRNAENALKKMQIYRDALTQIIERVETRNRFLHHPYFRKRSFDKGRDLVLVIVGDKGLCGNYNSLVIKEMARLHSESAVDFLLIGKKARIAAAAKGYSVVKTYDNDSRYLTKDVFLQIAEEIFALFPQYDRVRCLWTEFHSAVSREIQCKTLLPVVDGREDSKGIVVDYLYEMDEESVLEPLIHEYLLQTVAYNITEASVSEESARMTAMDAATSNAEDMTKSLTLLYNRARQAAITTEIIEISSGAEALSAS